MKATHTGPHLPREDCTDTCLSFIPSHQCFSVCRVRGKAAGFSDSRRAGCGSWALALAGQRGPGLLAHVRGICAGTTLGGDRSALHAQARLGGCEGGQCPSHMFCLAVGTSCVQCPCPTAYLPMSAPSGHGAVCIVRFSLFSAKSSST